VPVLSDIVVIFWGSITVLIQNRNFSVVSLLHPVSDMMFLLRHIRLSGEVIFLSNFYFRLHCYEIKLYVLIRPVPNIARRVVSSFGLFATIQQLG